MGSPRINSNEGWYNIPSTSAHHDLVRKLFSKLDTKGARSFLKKFTSFLNRLYNSTEGEDAQKWLLQEIKKVLGNYRGSAKIEVREISHKWIQKSIIVRFIGTDQKSKSERVILGAHLDSTSDDPGKRAPGADDNGSGTLTLFETLRTIVHGGISFDKTVEFHWYSAEEQGLWGSDQVAKSYKERKFDVVGMLNVDCTGFNNDGDNVIAVFTDNTNKQLTTFVAMLVDTYLSFGLIHRSCGYNCSDHVSWDKRGFPAAFISEAKVNKNYHTVKDTVGTINFRQIDEFVRLCIAYLVELGRGMS